MNRRSFLKTVGTILAAPAIVRADSLMRIVPVDTTVIHVNANIANITGGSINANPLWPGVKQWWGALYLGDLVTVTPGGTVLPAKVKDPIYGVVVGKKLNGEPIIETNPHKVYEIALPPYRSN